MGSVGERQVTLVSISYTLGVTLVAILIDAVVGDPRAVWSRIAHPVALIGRMIEAFESAWNSGYGRRAKGVLAVAVIVLASGAIGGILSALLATLSWGWIVEAALISILIAQKSLLQHFAAVAVPLGTGDLDGARAALAMIVGRDVAVLDGSGVARAGIETLAENASDGVVAPIFWAAVFGLPGILIYKAANTADSMIGHRDERFAEFGWAAARLDDLLNLLPARLTGLLICLAALFTPNASAKAAFGVLVRDAHKHASPNAGFPEAATAGALGLRLGGPRLYDGERDDSPWLGEGRADATRDDMEAARKLTVATFIVVFALILTVWVLLPR